MSTRAVYVFCDGNAPVGHVVYRHHDGYPSGAVKFIAEARKVAWPLPRFEADEFAASFVAANKISAGDVRLVGFGDWKTMASSDIEYVYIVRAHRVEAYSVSSDFGRKDWTAQLLFARPLAAIEAAPIPDNA